MNSLASGKVQLVTSRQFGQQRKSRFFCFYGSATIVIKRRISSQKFKMHECKNTTNGLEMKCVKIKPCENKPIHSIKLSYLARTNTVCLSATLVLWLCIYLNHLFHQLGSWLSLGFPGDS